MTIYAIVNNLIGEKPVDGLNRPIWTLISPSGVIQGGNPYFVPDFANHFEARLALAIRIGKLGKGIAPRFAGRYVDAVAPAMIFLATDLLNTLKEKGLPWTPALSYDKCLAIGKFSQSSLDQLKQFEVKLTLQSAGNKLECTCDSGSASFSIEDALAALSRDNTLKTGDIILFGVASNGPEVFPDMRAYLSLNGLESLNFNIR